MKNRKVTMICFLAGLILCFYPFISDLITQRTQEKTIATYQKDTSERNDLKEILEQARAYNDMLSQVGGAEIGNISETILSDQNYLRQLNSEKHGIMGTLEIPKININLPIRHGTAEEVIANGVGHFRESSLPVGGENTRCILTSHRGLPSARLFTRLDELKKDDLFFIHVCGETLAYQVYDIQVMEPEDVEELAVFAEKDIVTLVTCTPYGLNTHRLVVNGERVSYDQKVHDHLEAEMWSLRECAFLAIPLIFSAIMTGMYVRGRKRCK